MRLHPECNKKKTHYALHLADCAKSFGVWLDCFQTERYHKFGKQQAANIFNEFTSTLLAKTISKFMIEVQKLFAVDSMALVEPTKKVAGLENVLSGLGVAYVGSALGVKTPDGTFSKSDVVLWRDGSTFGVCVAEAFLRIRTDGCTNPSFLAFVRKYENVSGALWSKVRGKPALVSCAHLRMPPAHQHFDDNVRIAMPLIL